MKIKTLIFILCLVGINNPIYLSAQSQNTTNRYKAKNTNTTKVRTLKPTKYIKRDIRIGCDISPLILGFISPKRYGIDLSIETNLSQRLYGIVEGGFQHYSRQNTHIEYKAKGGYYRIGVDWNMRKSQGINDADILYLGARYAYSPFEQETPFYSITDSEWGNLIGSLPPEKAYAHWIEAIVGFKVEVLKNIFLGLGARLKVLLYSQTGDINPAAYIPGYARNYNTMVFNINYSLYYNIAWNYKKQKIAVYEYRD